MGTTKRSEILDGVKRSKIKPNNEDREGKQILEKADHETVIERLEKLVHFLKGAQKNEEFLEHIKKPLDYIEDYIEVSLKFIANGPFFNEVFPMEIKKYILSLAYSCDYQAFIAATVCQDWKNILEDRFKDKVVIGESCSKCKNSCCVKPVDMMKAAIVHKIKTHLVIPKSLIGIDSNLIVDALTSISKFTIANYSNHPGFATLPDFANLPGFAAFLQLRNARRRRTTTTLSNDQLGHLFESIENGDKIMEDVRLVLVNLQSLSQDRLANCLVNKTKRLTLDQADGRPDFNMLDVKTFIRKLQDSPNIKLTHLTLEDFSFVVKDGLANVVKALCNVENLKWSGQSRNVPLTSEILKRILKNIVQKSTKIKTLILDMEDSYDFRSLISSEDLKTLVSKLAVLHLKGVFSEGQLEVARSFQDVEVGQREFYFEEFINSVKKGSSQMF